MQGLLFRYICFVANHLLKLNKVRNTYFINVKIILYHVFSLNICDYSEYYQHQYYHNQLKNRTYIHLTSSDHL